MTAQEPSGTEEPTPRPTTIDEMIPEDWAEARKLLARFDAERGAR